MLPPFESLVFQDLVPLFCVMTLLGGGLLMIASASVRSRTEQLARRMALAQTGTRVMMGAQAQSQAGRQRKAVAYGTSEPESRQIIRLLSSLRLSDEKITTVFTTGRIALALGAGAISALSITAPSPLVSLLIALVAAIIGWFLPVMIVRWSMKRHASSVGLGLPGALELLAICVEAGLSLENGLQRVARELKTAQPALGDELSLTWAEMAILPSRDQALANMAERVDLPSVRSVVGTLAQSLRFGSPLAQSLRNAAEEMRNEQLMTLEEKANRLPAMMTVPVMLLIMPTIFLIVGGPAALRLLDIFQ
jgi:tight adherence protein C